MQQKNKQTTQTKTVQKKKKTTKKPPSRKLIKGRVSNEIVSEANYSQNRLIACDMGRKLIWLDLQPILTTSTKVCKMLNQNSGKQNFLNKTTFFFKV